MPAFSQPHSSHKGKGALPIGKKAARPGIAQQEAQGAQEAGKNLTQLVVCQFFACYENRSIARFFRPLGPSPLIYACLRSIFMHRLGLSCFFMHSSLGVMVLALVFLVQASFPLSEGSPSCCHSFLMAARAMQSAKAALWLQPGALCESGRCGECSKLTSITPGLGPRLCLPFSLNGFKCMPIKKAGVTP